MYTITVVNMKFSFSFKGPLQRSRAQRVRVAQTSTTTRPAVSVTAANTDVTFLTGENHERDLLQLGAVQEYNSFVTQIGANNGLLIETTEKII